MLEFECIPRLYTDVHTHDETPEPEVRDRSMHHKRFLVKHGYLYGGRWRGLQKDLWTDIVKGWRFKPKPMDST